MKYPKPLREGSTIAITAFSSGIAEEHKARFSIIKKHLESQGFKIVVGDCLYGQFKHVSAPIEQRVEELIRFLMDDNIDAIYPPWGGELSMELFPLIDFSKLQNVRPKWILGFSDVSTLAATFTSKLRWATAHCSNLMDLTPQAKDPLTSNTITYIGTSIGSTFSQEASTMYASQWPDIVSKPASGITPDTASSWKWLVRPKSSTTIEGRLIGGCWDTLLHLFDTEYLDLKALSEDYPEGIVLYLENAEMSPTDIARTILSMKFRGVFKHINGLVLGRNAAPDPSNEQALKYHEAIESSLANIGIPVMYDLDIGHVPPNLTLINGAVAKVELNDEVGELSQTLI
ncbi:S66 peptidase family protein [Vibrio sp. Hep-1b-8]|uniref:S66 family peptidase n=1 Tax=Vibrio sp. Hep-1b-8 TaxID=2144187 RepID=UPI001110BB05|nr:S66 peptidase family protein [Vibrio sp. Hep-1b-8]TMX33738.1 LD-carboxypeptidase [Vibrio sp. Hep-1b-8]